MKLRASFTMVIIVIGQSGGPFVYSLGNWQSTDPAAAFAACEKAAAAYRAKVPSSPTMDATKPGLNWSLRVDCVQKT